MLPTDTQKWSKIILRDTAFYLWGAPRTDKIARAVFFVSQSTHPFIHPDIHLSSDTQTTLARCERDHTGCEHQRVWSVGPSFRLFTTLTKSATKDFVLARYSKHLTVLSKYCGLHICVPPKFMCWSPSLHCDGIRKWGLWEVIMSGWSPHDEISSLIRRETRELASFLTLPSEDTTRKTVLTRSWIGWPFNLGLPSLHNCEK